MRKMFSHIILVSCCLVLLTAYAEDSVKQGNVEGGEAVFDLEYHVLPDPHGRVFNYRLLSFGSRSDVPQDEFTKSLNLTGPGIIYEMNPRLKELGWIAVDYREERNPYVYIDLDGNRKYTPNERIVATGSKNEVITPDIQLHVDNDQTLPYRLWLKINQKFIRFDHDRGWVDEDSRYIKAWSPACIFEGTSELDGEVYRMILFDYNVNGRFNDFGQDRILIESENQIETRTSNGEALNARSITKILSHLIYFNDTFYRLVIEDDMSQATLTKDNSPHGKMKLALQYDKEAWVKMKKVNIGENNRKDVFYEIPSLDSGEITLPAGTYFINSASIEYGYKEDEKWDIKVEKSAPFSVTGNSDQLFQLSPPSLTLSTVTYERMIQGMENRSVFKEGETVCIVPELTGQKGEEYSWLFHIKKSTFWQRYNDLSWYLILQQHRFGMKYKKFPTLVQQQPESSIKIYNSTGEVSERNYMTGFEPDGAGPNALWSRSKKGIYTITATYDTGPLAGVLTADTTVTIE
jgi:hypothetical protein